MKKIAELILFVFVLYGCTLRPKNILSDKEMEAVLYDMHLAEGIVPAAGYNGSQKSEQDACFRYVMNKHNINQAIFDSSIVWYTAHPKRFDKIYPRVIKRLEMERQTVIDRLEQEKDIALKGGKVKKSVKKLNVDSLLKRTSMPHPTVWQQVQDTLYSIYQVEPPLQ